MASTKVIAITCARKDLANKLKATLKRMDDEIATWEKQSATLDERQKAWDKKAVLWAKKNLAKAYEVDTNSYHNRFALSFNFKSDEAVKALGERPSIERKPDYRDTNYSKNVSDYEQVENALALIELGTDTEFKITTSSVWASFIR